MAIRFSVETDGITRTYLLARSVITIGRSGTCSVNIDDAALSRSHCQLESELEGAYVRDLNSRNGTLLNGKRVQRAQLKPGDLLKIGESQISILPIGEETSALAPAESASWTTKLFAPLKGRKKKKTRSTEEDSSQLRRLLRINRKIAEELEIEKLLTLILDGAIDLVSAERGFIVMYEDDELYVPVARDFWQKDIADPHIEVSYSIAQEVIRLGMPLIAADAAGDKRFEAMQSVHNLQLRSVICVPLAAGEKRLGALYLDNRLNRGSFENHDQDVLEAFADQAAISIRNSDSLRQTRDQGVRWKREADRHQSALTDAHAQMQQLQSQVGWRHGYSAIVGRSDAMKKAIGLVDKVADSSLSVLIQGESGVGKKLLARVIHRYSKNAEGPFVVLDCAATSSESLEAELYAQSAVERPSNGILARADGGTLLLDHVDELSASVSASLLRFLEDNEAGSSAEGKPESMHVRILSTARRDLMDAVRSGDFREDLLFRLRGVQVDLPTLRDRADDIPILTRHFLQEIAATVEWSPDALKALVRYDWPGNVRELRNEVIRACQVADGTVGIDDLSETLRHSAANPQDAARPLKDHVEALERALITQALTVHGGNKTRVAADLGLSRLGLRKKMARYGL